MRRYAFESEEEERNFLSIALSERYPYRQTFYERLSIRQLWAMLDREPRKPRQAEIPPDYRDEPTPPRLGDPDYKPLLETIDGEGYILADSGEYVLIEG